MGNHIPTKVNIKAPSLIGAGRWRKRSKTFFNSNSPTIPQAQLCWSNHDFSRFRNRTQRVLERK